MDFKYDFSGWATRNNIKCTDGRTILKDAFKHCDGMKVPLVWGHRHDDPLYVLGHALLENREEGVYTYCKFNDTESGRSGKALVEHGDITQLSIYANQLKQDSANNVMHGSIREVSLVLAGANKGAVIDSIMAHGEDSDEEAIIYTGEDITLTHSEEETESEVTEQEAEESQETENQEGELTHMAEETKKPEGGKTAEEVWETLNEDQKNLVYAMIEAVEEEKGGEENEENSEEGEQVEMKHNAFSDANDVQPKGLTLTHADEEAIIASARNNRTSLQQAIANHIESNTTLKHAFVDAVTGDEAIDQLFPEYKDVRPGAPEFIERDQGWVGNVMKKVHKSPISRIRTRQADITGTDLRALGYEKGTKKEKVGNIKLLSRTTDPQTVYRTDALERDDIIDITDFDVVAYQYYVMKQNLKEEIAQAIMIGDQREDGDKHKIKEEHIRSIWHDDELYTIHYDVDIEAAREELQGTDTNKHFGENYIYAEAIVTAALYSREKYKGSGSLDFFCTPHLLNVMLLARDLNGRRIYDSKADLAAALNVNNIYTIEQFEGKTRTTKEGDVKKLLGIFVNLKDYQVGSTKGGEITNFKQFDIDYNQEKYLIETRMSGALTRVKSAIVLEEPEEATSGASEE